MSFTKPEFPPLDSNTFLDKPLMERMQVLTQHWVHNGFGSPRMVHAIYIAKLVFFYALGGVAVATVTSGLPAFWHVDQWWNQPILYQKTILWTVLLEAIGVGFMRPAGRQGQADDRRDSVLGPVGHHPATPVEVGTVPGR